MSRFRKTSPKVDDVFPLENVSGIFEYLVPPTPCAENAKINVTDEPYFGTQIVCNYLPFSKAAKGAQGGPLWDLNCLPHMLQTKLPVIVVNIFNFKCFNPFQVNISLRLTLELCFVTFTFLMTRAAGSFWRRGR